MRKLKIPWIEAYQLYSDNSGSPKNYLLWSALHAVSASLKRSVWLRWAPYTIYPHQYIVLVGGPAIGKGTAINPAVDLVNKVMDNSGTPYVNYLYDRMSAEKIIALLSKGFSKVIVTGGSVGAITDSSASIVSTEFQTFISTSEWMLGLLCDMWDKNRFDYQMKNSPPLIIKDVNLNLLAACVPDYIRRLNKDSTVSVTSGFTSRCIFVFAKEPRQRVFMPVDMVGSQLELDLIHDLGEIGNLRGQYVLSPSAYTYLKTYYEGIKVDEFDSEVITHFKGRMHSHVVKNAICFAASESDTLVIELHHVTAAVSLVGNILTDLDMTFKNVGESSMLVATERIIDYMNMVGTASYQDIFRNNYKHVTDEDLKRILFTMQNSLGFITIINIGGKDVYKTTGGFKQYMLNRKKNIEETQLAAEAAVAAMGATTTNSNGVASTVVPNIKIGGFKI